MKKLLLTIACLSLLLFFMPMTALAEDTAPADGYNDHDYNAIRSFLETETGGVKNGTLVNSSYDANDPTTWSVSWEVHGSESYVRLISWNSKGIQGALNLTEFSYLDSIYVDGNSLTSLDVSDCALLKYVGCSSNSLSSVNVSGDTALEWLCCQKNSLTSLDTSAVGTSLHYLYCNDNQIDTLNISSNTALKRFQCHKNQLTSLNVSGFSALEELICMKNGLTSLNISGCTALTKLDCSDNKLTSLDVSASTLLAYLYCENNELTSLSVPNYVLLKELYCDHNQLSALNVSGCTALEKLYCDDNILEELDVSTNIALSDILDCCNNHLTTLDLSYNTALKQLECQSNLLTFLDISHNTELSYLSCGDNSISALDVSHNPKLKYLYCYSNRLTSLDASMCPLIEYLICAENPTTQINANIYGAVISLTAGKGGYVALGVDWESVITVGAVSIDPAVFYDWTDTANVQFSTTANTDLDWGVNYDLTANFLSLTADPTDGSINVGGHITITPSILGGTWDFDHTKLSMSDNVFTGKKAGATRVTYTIGNKSVYFDVAISDATPDAIPDDITSQTVLPLTGEDSMEICFLVGTILSLAGIVLILNRNKKRR